MTEEKEQNFIDESIETTLKWLEVKAEETKENKRELRMYYNTITLIQGLQEKLQKQQEEIEKLTKQSKNLDKEAQSYLEELAGDSGMKERTIAQLQKELEKKEYLYQKALSDTVLADKELKKKDKIIDTAIKEIETLRQYFSEDLQPDFIRILEILKDKKVIDW